MAEMRNPTTILPPARGVPALVVRDHDGWAAQVAAERRERQDEQIKAAVAAIRRADEERRWTPPTPRDELEAGMRANMALAAEARDVLPRTMRELAQTEALLAAYAAGEPPRPDAAEARRARDNEYSFALGETMARLR